MSPNLDICSFAWSRSCQCLELGVSLCGIVKPNILIFAAALGGSDISEGGVDTDGVIEVSGFAFHQDMTSGDAVAVATS